MCSEGAAEGKDIAIVAVVFRYDLGARVQHQLGQLQQQIIHGGGCDFALQYMIIWIILPTRTHLKLLNATMPEV